MERKVSANLLMWKIDEVFLLQVPLVMVCAHHAVLGPSVLLVCQQYYFCSVIIVPTTIFSAGFMCVWFWLGLYFYEKFMAFISLQVGSVNFLCWWYFLLTRAFTQFEMWDCETLQEHQSAASVKLVLSPISQVQCCRGVPGWENKIYFRNNWSIVSNTIF
jgi:hypothetical protein